MALHDEPGLDIPAFKRLPDSKRPARRGAAAKPRRRYGLVLVALAAVSLGVGAALLARIEGEPGEVPLITAEPGPVRVRPDDPGGARIANQDRLVYDRGAQRNVPGDARMLPPPEAPLPPPVATQAGAVQGGAGQGGAGAGQAVAALGAAGLAGTGVPGAGANGQTQLGAAGADAAGSVVPQGVPGSDEDALALARAILGRSEPPGPVRPALPTPPTPMATGTQLAVTQAAMAPPRPVNANVQVQLAAVPSQGSAQSEWQRMARRWPDLLGGKAPVISASTGRDGKAVYRVRTGGFSDAEAANEFCGEVRSRGGQCVLARF